MGKGQAGDQHSDPAAWWSRRRKVWAGEKILSSLRDSFTGPSHLFPGVSPPDRRALCLFLFKERGRPISLPGAYRSLCVLIFQSSDLTAFYRSSPSPNSKRSHSLLLDQLLDGEELGATAMTGGPGPCYAALTCAPAGWVWGPHLHSRPFRAGIGAHIRAAAVGARVCREWAVPTALKPGGWRGLAEGDWAQRSGWDCRAGLTGGSGWWACGSFGLLPPYCPHFSGGSVILAIPYLPPLELLLVKHTDFSPSMSWFFGT